MEYTKGKWDKDGNKVKVHGRGIVAICPSPTEDYGVIEFVANTHLIASAPDLYEACKESFNFLVDIHNLIMEHPEYAEKSKETNNKLWQAITKVKGG